MAFSPDGRTLATGSTDRTARLWNVTDPTRTEPMAALSGHTKAIDALAFSPGGQLLATGGEDWTALLWDTDADRVADRVCAVVHPVIDEIAWKQYLPSTSYQPPCDLGR